MDAFEKWWVSDEAWQCHCDWCDDHDNHLVSFRAGMRAAALIVADHSPDTNPGSPCNAAVAAILAEADK